MKKQNFRKRCPAVPQRVKTSVERYLMSAPCTYDDTQALGVLRAVCRRTSQRQVNMYFSFAYTAANHA